MTTIDTRIEGPRHGVATILGSDIEGAQLSGPTALEKRYERKMVPADSDVQRKGLLTSPFGQSGEERRGM